MTQQKTATLTKAEQLGSDTRLLSFRMSDGDLGFAGGQYIIVDSGIPIAGDKIAKRAYSVLSADRDQQEFQLGVRRIGDGPGSNFMHRLEQGSRLKFSGPWGKFVTDSAIGCDTLIFATDTGITAALGLLRGRAMEGILDRVRILWFAESENYFLPFAFVIEEFDRIGLRNFSVVEAPPVANTTRVRKALDLIEGIATEETPGRAFLCGDGAVIHAVRERLITARMSAESILLECFFNNPQRKAAI